MKDKNQPKVQLNLPDIIRRKGDTVSINLDCIEEEEKQAVLDIMLAKTKTKLTRYEGAVEYGYDLNYVTGHRSCPRCSSALQQHYADFIYATQRATRVMFAPAGHFCTACPTVVIDQALLQKGVSENFRYQGVLGVEGANGERGGFFKTWNDEKVVYVLDKERITMAFLDGKDTTNREISMEKKVLKNRKKKKLEKLSKKKNRGKR